MTKGFLAALLAMCCTLTAQAKLANGPYAKMEMLVERTLLKADVARLVVRFDDSTRDVFERLVQGKPYSEQIEDSVASCALGARDVMVQMKFLRDIDFDQFETEVNKSIECARESKMVDTREPDRVKQGLPIWFAPIRERGLKEGDRVVYYVQGDTVRTVLFSVDNRKLVDYMHRGANPRGSVMASYFANCSSFREPLIKSLFESTA